MRKAHLILLAQLAATSAFADAYGRTQTGLYIPNRSIEAVRATEVTGFNPEWCAKNQEQNSAAVQGCFGRLQLAERSVRALLVTLGDGSRRVFFEANPSTVELRNLSFSIIAAGQGASAEQGRASIAIDARGEVIGVIAMTPKIGRVQIVRGRTTAN